MSVLTRERAAQLRRIHGARRAHDAIRATGRVLMHEAREAYKKMREQARAQQTAPTPKRKDENVDVRLNGV